MRVEGREKESKIHKLRASFSTRVEQSLPKKTKQKSQLPKAIDVLTATTTLSVLPISPPSIALKSVIHYHSAFPYRTKNTAQRRRNQHVLEAKAGQTVTRRCDCDYIPASSPTSKPTLE
jgi:hypothetical protein